MDKLKNIYIKELVGSILAAVITAITFYLPYLLDLPKPYWIVIVIFYFTIVHWSKLTVGATLNPVIHFQNSLLYGENPIRFLYMITFHC